MMRKIVAIFYVVVLSAFAQQKQGLYKVTVDRDTILAADEEVKITVFTGKSDVNFSCAARKGGGTFSEFKVVQTPSGQGIQTVFKSPYPGETEIEILDVKYNKVGFTDVTVVAPKVEILEEQSLDKYNEQGGVALNARIFPVLVRVTDHRGQSIKTAKLSCKLQEIVNKKFVSTQSKVTEFVWREDHYEGNITNLKAASYRIEIFDDAHLDAYDKADNPDYPHPSTLIEGLNIE